MRDIYHERLWTWGHIWFCNQLYKNFFFKFSAPNSREHVIKSSFYYENILWCTCNNRCHVKHIYTQTKLTTAVSYSGLIVKLKFTVSKHVQRCCMWLWRRTDDSWVSFPGCQILTLLFVSLDLTIIHLSPELHTAPFKWKCFRSNI